VPTAAVDSRWTAEPGPVTPVQGRGATGSFRAGQDRSSTMLVLIIVLIAVGYLV